MLEKYDSPIIMINQPYQGEDWGVVATYVSEQDVLESEEAGDSDEIGWYVRVTLPNLDDVDFDQVFSSPEAAIEYGVKQILSGNVMNPKAIAGEPTGKVGPFGEYLSIA